MAKSERFLATPILTIKERSIQKRKAAEARKELISTITNASAVAVLLGIILFVVAGVKTAVPVVLGVIVMSLSYKYPRQALFAFIIYVPMGGTITYYLGNSPILQLAKDAFYFPALIGLWRQVRQQGLPLIIPPGMKTPLFIVLSTSLLTLVLVNGGQQFNPPPVQLGEEAPHDLPIGMGILGLKVFLGYVPLISCAYYLIQKKQDFLFLSRLQVSLTLICCTLGLVQYFLLLTGICNGTRGLEGDALFKASLDARCYFGGSLLYTPDQGVIRLPGTFVAPWQWGWFLISSTFLTFAAGFSDPAIIWRLFSFGSLALVFINALISGQRTALLLVPIFFVILLLFTGQIGNLKRFVPAGIGLTLILGMVMLSNPELVQERIENFSERWQAAPPQEFLVDQFQENWKSVATPIGSGLGRATNSARSMGETKLVETYYPKVLFEVGIVGVMAFLGLVTSLTMIAFKTYRSLKDRNYRTYGATLFVFVLFISYNTFYYPLDVDPVAVYYWFFAGVLFKLPILEKQDKPTQEKNGKSYHRRSKASQHS